VNDTDLEMLGALIDDQLPEDEAEALKLRIESEPELLAEFSRMLEATDAFKISAFKSVTDRALPFEIQQLLRDAVDDTDELFVSNQRHAFRGRRILFPIAASVALIAFLGWISLEVMTIRSSLTTVQNSIHASSSPLGIPSDFDAPIGSSTANAQLKDESTALFVAPLQEKDDVRTQRSSLAALNHPVLRMVDEFRRQQSTDHRTLGLNELQAIMTKIWGQPVILPSSNSTAIFQHGRAVALGGQIMANLTYRVDQQEVDLWITPSSDADQFRGYYQIDEEGVVIESIGNLTYATVASGTKAELQDLMAIVVSTRSENVREVD